MAAGNVGDIIIKGGSVEIMFDEQIFPRQGGKYGNKEKKIASVEVTDDITGRSQSVNLSAIGKCTIKISTP